MSDVVKFWVQIASIVITVTSISLAIHAWSRTRTFIRRRQDPNKRVPDYTVLSYTDVEAGIEKLAHAAQRLKPDHVVGINRGGAIVGGCLAKKLHIPDPAKNSGFFLLNVYLPRPEEPLEKAEVIEQRADSIQIKAGDTVLLVDDSMRTASHMALAEKYLLKTYEDIKLKKYVLLHVAPRLVGPEPYNVETQVDECAFVTSGGHVLWPWDPDEALKSCREEAKKVQK